MGLGKTLATLTSVLMSVNSALEFANRKTYKKSGRERISTTTVSKATVVVVPSECKTFDPGLEEKLDLADLLSQCC